MITVCGVDYARRRPGEFSSVTVLCTACGERLSYPHIHGRVIDGALVDDIIADFQGRHVCMEGAE